MKAVTWTVYRTTVVDTDDDDVAKEEVSRLFEDATWGYTGACQATFERMGITGVTDVIEFAGKNGDLGKVSEKTAPDQTES